MYMTLSTMKKNKTRLMVDEIPYNVNEASALTTPANNRLYVLHAFLRQG